MAGSSGTSSNLIEQIRRQVEAMPGLGWAAWSNGDFIWQSAGMAAHTGFSQEDFVSRDAEGGYLWQRLLHPQDYPRLAQSWMAAVEGARVYDVSHRVRTASGEFRWLQSTARAQLDAEGEVVYWLGTSIDIHAAVSSIEAAQENERWLRTLIDTVPTPIWSCDPIGRPVFFNEALSRQVGIEIGRKDDTEPFSLEGILSKVVSPEDRDDVAEALRHALATGETFKRKYRQLRADGGFRWTSGKAAPLRDENGQIIRWLGVAVDIDDEISAHAALAEREERLALIVETIPGLVWASNTEGIPIYLSKQFEDWSGVKLDNLLKSNQDLLTAIIEATIHPDDRVAVKSSIKRCMVSGEKWFLRFRQLRGDGAWRWMEGRMQPLRDAQGAIVQWFGLQVDIDNEMHAQESLRIAQERLARAAQFAGMAELTASIAHEVSQPLASVVASAAACRRWLEMDAPNIERAKLSADAVLRDANSASDVVRHVRALFQHDFEDRRLQDVNHLVRTARDLVVEELVSSGVRLELDLDNSLPRALVDAVQIQQVLVNLIRNAFEAIGEDNAAAGLVSVTTRAREKEILVEVSDTGGGIEDVDRIFVPFFSTKATGMGIGLSICRTIITSHGGRMSARNTDVGATLSFSLPLYPEG